MSEQVNEPKPPTQPVSGGWAARLVEARIEPAMGDETKLFISRTSIPWHHRARIWGAVTAIILISGLGSGFFLTKSFGSSLQPVDPTTLQLLRDRNEILREEVAKLEKARPRICTPGALNDLDLGGGPMPGVPEAQRAPGHLSNQQLNDLLEENTAYIEVDTGRTDNQGRKLVGTGSGFFIAPDVLVTNKHVTGNARADQITIHSQRLGPRRRAVQLLASSAEIRADGDNYPAGQEDFALLRVPGANRTKFLSVRADTVAKRADVTAAGYPGYEVVQDRERGSDTPELILTSGRVKVVRNVREFNTVVIEHMAEIAQGNSGGPLVDACGYVAGVNTFVASAPESQNANAYQFRLPYALSSASLQVFLKRNNVQFKVAGACNN